MQTKLLFLSLVLSTSSLFAQQDSSTTSSKSSMPETQTLFKNNKVRGGFGGPIFSWSQANGKTGYGAGGGGGVVMDRFFVGLFGMGETFDRVNIGQDQLVRET